MQHGKRDSPEEKRTSTYKQKTVLRDKGTLPDGKRPLSDKMEVYHIENQGDDITPAPGAEVSYAEEQRTLPEDEYVHVRYVHPVSLVSVTRLFNI